VKNNYEKFLSNRAKEMRTSPTKAEQKMKEFLNERKIPYKSQKVIMVSKDKGYIVDFLLWKKVILEVDGSVHESKESKDKGAEDLSSKSVNEIVRETELFLGICIPDAKIVVDTSITMDEIIAIENKFNYDGLGLLSRLKMR
jgi:very-short-patch-repair endonuclease